MADSIRNPVRQRNLLSVLGLVVIAVLFIAAVTFSNQLFRSARLDLTENNLYTLSEGTKQVLSEIEEPIRLRFYYSKRISEELPDIGAYAQRVRDMLEEYAALADGKIRLFVRRGLRVDLGVIRDANTRRTPRPDSEISKRGKGE